MKRRWMWGIGIVIFVVIVYTWGWGQSYFTAKHYFADAEQNLQAGKIGLALKGTPSNKGDTQDYQGGFEQVVNSWSSPWSFPKPQYYWKAKKAVGSAINSITSSQAHEIVSTYINLDAQYLPQILLSVGKRSLAKGDITTATQTYQVITQAFSADPSAVAKAKEQLKKISKLTQKSGGN